MPNAKSDEPLEIYLRQVRENLRGLPESDASEIIQELRSHVLDRVAGDLSDTRVKEALASLGDPRDIGRLNSTMRVAARAAGQTSPRVVARTLAQLARLSVRGLITLLISLAGYGFAAVWLLTAMVKPFAPNRVGLWSLPDPTGDLSLSLGRHDPGLSGRDILGWWIIPIGLVVGLTAALLTFRYHQRAIRQMAHPAGAEESSDP